MAEKEKKQRLRDSATVDPFEIGKTDMPVSSPDSLKAFQKRIMARFFQERATENEVKDLLNIDTNGMTLDDVLEYAENLVVWNDPGGRATGLKEKMFRESKMVLAWLQKKEYRAAIKFFLEKAKKEWRGPEDSGNGPDYFRVNIVDGFHMAAVPVEIQLQGDSAIKEHIAREGMATVLKLAHINSRIYLKQAAVLAKAIAET